jgi:hypothetical protein
MWLYYQGHQRGSDISGQPRIIKENEEKRRIKHANVTGFVTGHRRRPEARQASVNSRMLCHFAIQVRLIEAALRAPIG